jgi:23S rRNA pseudouridine1911/1915/1917 synthase
VSRELRAVQRLERPFLHSARLSFTHPGDGRRVEFDSPLPLDLQSVIDDIEERSAPPESD